MTPGLLVLLILLTTYRTTRLIIEDTFPPIGVPREKFLNWLKPTDQRVIAEGDVFPKGHLGALGRSLHYLFTCPWCMSVWVGAGIIWGVMQYVSVPMPILVWAASSAVTGLLANLEEKLSS